VSGRAGIVSIVLSDQSERVGLHQACPLISTASARVDACDDTSNLLGGPVHELLHLSAPKAEALCRFRARVAVDQAETDGLTLASIEPVSQPSHEPLELDLVVELLI
jgi:hypothetical protein